MPLKTCAVSKCQLPVKAKTYCYAHYTRLWRNGEVNEGKPVVRRGLTRLCRHCDGVVVAKDLCARHYFSLRKYGDPLFVSKNKNGDQGKRNDLNGVKK